MKCLQSTSIRKCFHVKSDARCQYQQAKERKVVKPFVVTAAKKGHNYPHNMNGNDARLILCEMLDMANSALKNHSNCLFKVS